MDSQHQHTLKIDRIQGQIRYAQRKALIFVLHKIFPNSIYLKI